MTDRFDLEQQLLECWNVTSDINTLSESVMDQNLSQDEIVNILIGIKSLYEIKFNKVWNTFEQLINDKKIL